MYALNSSEVNAKFLCSEIVVDPSKMICCNIKLLKKLDDLAWGRSVADARDTFLCARLGPIWEFCLLCVLNELRCRFEFLFGWL